MACCPFHHDKTPCMKLDERYYCFGCGATGDAVDLTRQLLHLNSKDAAYRIANDFGIPVDEPEGSRRIETKPDCMSHDIYEGIVEMPWSVTSTTISDALDQARTDLGEKAVVELDREIATTATCDCGEHKELFIPVHKLKGAMLTCPKCGRQMTFESKHSFNGSEEYIGKTFDEIGIPPLHIISGRVGMNIKHYEFSGDVDSVFRGL